jgi:hypothetical protein
MASKKAEIRWSGLFKLFWTPAFAGVTGRENFLGDQQGLIMGRFPFLFIPAIAIFLSIFQ